jgi:hypothetical protein
MSEIYSQTRSKILGRNNAPAAMDSHSLKVCPVDPYPPPHPKPINVETPEQTSHSLEEKPQEICLWQKRLIDLPEKSR